MRTLIKDIVKNEGQKVELNGWVDVRRDHGKIIFIDLRDRSSKCQVVFIGKDKDLYAKAIILRPEWVVKITGQVNKRPDKLINKDLDTGEYEILAEEMEILNESKTPPFELGTDGYEVNEEIRMKNRYLDVRRERLQKNIRNRSKMITFATNFLQDKDFVQVETPVLSKSTPEGARDYLVPSRVQPGKFYALPQSPQQYKQLLMTSGIERYFQFARCFRDEDTRGDRQPEFTQLDMEMSFVEEEDVMGVVEEMLIKMIGELYPEKKIQTVPFPRMTYKEAMDKYGTDRPDLRENKDDPNLLAFCWVVDFPFFEKTDDGKWTFTHNPFSAPKPEYMKMLMDGENIGEILTTQYDISLNGWEIAGGSIRNHQSEALRKVFEVMGLEEEKVQENFGHMLEAFNNGTPPHGGIAYGFDRLVMILQNEPNIREVIAFPKTGDGRDLMMEAPSEAGKDQLKELSIEINPVRDKKSDGK